MSTISHAPSYYAATANEETNFPALSADISCDVCIIGAGYTGLSAALHLAERGYGVVLVEAGKIGWGASGRNGGQLGNTQRQDQHALEKMVGKEAARALWDLGLASANLVKDLIAKHAIACDLKPGILHAAWKRSDADDLRGEQDHLARDYGATGLRFIERGEMAEMLGTSRYWGGLLSQEAGHLHPLNFALGLGNACRKAGVQIFEQTQATAISRTDPARVTTPQGTVTAAHVVLACNGYLDGLEKRMAGRIMPINNFVIATEPLGEDGARALIRDDVAVADTKFVIDYYRLSADKRLLFGGGENYSSTFPRDIASFVRKPMLRVFPQLEKVKIDYAWGGTLAITLNRMPDLGRLPPNIFYAQGYSGQGLNMATLAGQLIAEALAGTAERFDVMSKVPTPTFPGGTWLRYPGLVAGMLFYALKDRLP